ncbi:MAG: hypothetical protein HY700_15415 [Gemmatimonadetes bacterium]|nr:hypothetical protein [Gemmatimonadota bacterium]
MRQSTALLPETQVRLNDLHFPHNRVHVHRTRLAFIHLDNLLHFAKIDRDGRLDGYVAAYLPDQVVLLLMRRGEVINAVSFAERARTVIPIATALKEIRDEVERGELAYCDAPMEQLAWTYSSCATPPKRHFVDAAQPASLFPALRAELFTGVLEFISNGRMSYFRFEDGKFLNGYYCGKPDQMTVPQYVESLFQADAAGTRPQIAATVFPPLTEIPEQAAPAMIETYRELFWRIVDAAERELPGEGMKRAYKLRDALGKTHAPLPVIGTPRDREADPLVTTAEQLTFALSDWALQLLEQLEIMSPGAAEKILREATKEQRFMLQKAGFFSRLPWAIRW